MRVSLITLHNRIYAIIEKITCLPDKFGGGEGERESECVRERVRGERERERREGEGER